MTFIGRSTNETTGMHLYVFRDPLDHLVCLTLDQLRSAHAAFGDLLTKIDAHA